MDAKKALDHAAPVHAIRCSSSCSNQGIEPYIRIVQDPGAAMYNRLKQMSWSP